MANPRTLTLEDRYYLSMYSRRLQCTLELRFAIDAFLQQIQITEAEIGTYGIKIDVDNKTFSCNDPSYTVEYANIPASITTAMGEYVNAVENSKQTNELILRTAEYFRKLA